MFFKSHPSIFIQLETKLYFFIYLLYMRFFANFENDPGFLESFYLLFFIEFTLAN